MKQVLYKIPNIVWKILFLALTGFLFFWISQIGKEPNFWIDKHTVDNGRYLAEDRVFHVSGNNKEAIGSHVMIVGQPESFDQRKQGCFMYMIENLRTDQDIILMSEEQLSHKQLEIDGLVVGYLKAENGNIGKYYPVLHVTGILSNEESYLDLAAPIQSVVEPAVSVNAADVSLTLNRIEYREKLARVFFTVNNQSESPLYLYAMNIRSDQREIGGTLLFRSYQAPLQIAKYLKGGKDELPLLLLNPGESCTAKLGTLSIQMDNPVEILLDYVPMEQDMEQFITDNGDLEHIELQLRYLPGETEEAETLP